MELRAKVAIPAPPKNARRGVVITTLLVAGAKVWPWKTEFQLSIREEQSKMKIG
jgi:hypothetical protein